MKFSFKITSTYPEVTIVHHIDENGGVWATSKRVVLCLDQHHWEPIAKFPFSFPRDLFAFSRPTSRIMRSDKSNIYVNKFNKVLGIRGGQVFAIEDNQARFLFSIQGDCVLHRSIVEDKDGFIYFGEYFMNPDRKPVRIWQVSPQLDSWEIASQFDEIRHVHGIFLDPYKPDEFWVTVGDFMNECYILHTADRFSTFHKYGDGSQQWRAVNLFFTSHHVCWLTDSNLEQNHACRMHRESKQLEIGQTIDASVWYGCTTQDQLHLAFTTIEKGPAIMSDESEVLVSQDAFQWVKVHSFKKDFWRPVKIFKYGVISCPSGKISSDDIFLSGEGLVDLDGMSIRASIKLIVE